MLFPFIRLIGPQFAIIRLNDDLVHLSNVSLVLEYVHFELFLQKHFPVS